MIETERLLLRRLQAADLDALAALWANPDVTRFMGGPRVASEVRANLEADLRAEPHRFDLWPVLDKATGRVVGHCGLLDKEIDGQPEVSLEYVFAREAWGRGFATEMGRALLGYAFTHVGLARIVAIIDPDNAASERVAGKLGMRHVKDSQRPSGHVKRIFALDALTRGPD